MADIETSKRNAANRAVEDHFPREAKYIGIGSGTTIVYVVEEIKALKNVNTAAIRFVPTGYQSRQVIIKADLTPIAFDSLPEGTLLDVAFDGADEIDEDLNCIKGGGACLYQEKLVAKRAKKFICVADSRKLQPRLLSKWPTIPIEVEPLSAGVVLSALRDLGSSAPFVREGHLQKAGPIKTDQDNFIIDAPFPTLLLPSDITGHTTNKDNNNEEIKSDAGGGGEEKQEKRGKGGKDRAWEVEALAHEIKMLEGVLSVGLFVGMNGEEAERKGLRTGGEKPVAAYFGMPDGGVVVRRAGEGRRE